ncbi:MAG TPA: lysozyme inhibitor LprI family protein [Ferruginibacter sp.]|nr:lysozyme inhibitor LprI family protein [Ferruginibacter sp.]
MFKTILLVTFILIGYASYAQTAATVNDLDSSYRTCLDNGTDMYGCAVTNYAQMDSLLNVVYKKLHTKYSSSAYSQLKTEQKNWLKTRKAYFKKIDAGNAEGLVGQGRMMFIEDEKSTFVRARVLDLIKRYTE